MEHERSAAHSIKTTCPASSSQQDIKQVKTLPSHALSMEDSGCMFDTSPPPRGSNRLPPAGSRPGAGYGPGQQQLSTKSDMSLCSKFSSGSGGGLDRAIDAARANEEDGEEDYDMDADVRFLHSGVSIDSAEARSLQSFSLATPFAAPQLQSAQSSDIPTRILHDLLPGSESLSLDEQDLYKHLVKELQSDGTLSSEISELLSELQVTSSNASSTGASEEQLEVQREKVEEVIQRLRSRLLADKAAQLRTFDSYGLLDLYNHHHTASNGGRSSTFS